MTKMSAPPFIRLNPQDQVVIARRVLNPGDPVEGSVLARESIAAGHKVAVAAIAKGAPVRRYGQIIGFASADIAAGQHVHMHNVEMKDFSREHAFSADVRPTVPADPPATFQGIVRADGRVATRNYVGILTSVNCSATVAGYVADAFRRNPITGYDPLSDFPNVDGVVALTHKTGCGMASDGDGIATLRRTLSGYARHPNFGAVVMLGLGCEANQVDELVRIHRLKDRSNGMPTFTIQTEGGTRKTVERAVAAIRELLPEANRVSRQTVPASHLALALQCGGSDGYSGITANPALGFASDLLVQNGGTVILSETPETYGAEHILTRRAVSREVGEKLLALMTWWEGYTAKNGGDMDNNPSPGNKAGGITTILEKSLGAVAKAGSTNLVDVIRYAEALKTKGFVFMDSPGYDPVSATGQVASGANVVCFTTGRGSVFGCVPTPSIKIATNSALFARMPDDMDENAGGIVDGTDTVEACGRRIFQQVLEVASGRPSKSEALGFGEAEFAPWQLGAVM